jgi:hypothetical protein
MGFLSNHARVLVCIARDPEVRLRDIGATVGITVHHAHVVVNELTEAGYIVKGTGGPSQQLQIQVNAPLGRSRQSATHDRAADDVSAWITERQKAALRPDLNGPAWTVRRIR